VCDASCVIRNTKYEIRNTQYDNGKEAN